MKDIEDRLWQSEAPKPRRELSSDFTASVLGKISDEPKSSGFWFSRSRALFSKRTPVPLAAVLVALGIMAGLGGVTYALTDGFDPSKLPFLNARHAGTMNASDGSAIVTVKTNECSLKRLNGSSGADEDRTTFYFKIVDPEQVTPEEITRTVQGSCEMEKEDTAQAAAFNRYFKSDVAGEDPYDFEGYSSTNEVVRIDDTSLDIVFTSRTYDENGEFVSSEEITKTFVKGDEIEIERANGESVAWNDIKVGQHLFIIYELGTGPISAVYVGIESPNVTAAMETWGKSPEAFVEVEPCDGDPSGYCEQ